MTYLFSPPPHPTGEVLSPKMDETAKRLFSHFAVHQRGYTILKNGDVYVQGDEMYLDDINAADIVYLGGHIYEVSAEEAQDLVDAGYEVEGFSEIDPFALLTEAGEPFLTEAGEQLLVEH